VFLALGLAMGGRELYAALQPHHVQRAVAAAAAETAEANA